jgi:hypothetical protein
MDVLGGRGDPELIGGSAGRDLDRLVDRGEDFIGGDIDYLLGSDGSLRIHVV